MAQATTNIRGPTTPPKASERVVKSVPVVMVGHSFREVF